MAGFRVLVMVLSGGRTNSGWDEKNRKKDRGDVPLSKNKGNGKGKRANRQKKRKELVS